MFAQHHNDCLENGNPSKPDCEGAMVSYLTPLGTKIVRCELHQEEADARAEAHNNNYPDSHMAPEWFDPTFAGERWDDDY